MNLSKLDCQRLAQQQVMQDLLECLWSEGFFDAENTALEPPLHWQNCHMKAREAEGKWPIEQVWTWHPEHPVIRQVWVPARPGIAQVLLSVAGAPVYAMTHSSQIKTLNAIDMMSLVNESLGDRMPGSPKGVELFIEALQHTLEQTTWSYRHNISTTDLLARSPGQYFQAMEQWGALRDRPYHPAAKAKISLNQADYHHYVAEFDQKIYLKWVAIRRDHLLVSEPVDAHNTSPAEYLLNDRERAELDLEIRERDLKDYLAIPILAWQLDQGLPEALQHDATHKHWVPLAFQGLAMKSTSSVRSLAPLTESVNYLKLPMSLYSLGSSRYLPAVKMMNGVIAQGLLAEAITRDPVLEHQVFYCDESHWWAFMPPEASLFDDYPRHLSAMVRRYPEALLEDPECRLVPMSALGTLLPDHQDHCFDHWLEHRRLPSTESSVLGLFQEVCDTFLELNLRLFRLGIMPEIHGQNAVLVWRKNRVDGLLLRDHDSLRLFVPWLNQAGLDDPVFRLKKGVSNTLYHDTAEDLLFYLLSLGIQVNLRAIIDTLAQRYCIEEKRLWLVLRYSLTRQIDRVAFSAEARELLHRVCFEQEHWPLKLLVRPMLERAGGPGSMPFGKGWTVNPLKRLSTPPDATVARSVQAVIKPENISDPA